MSSGTLTVMQISLSKRGDYAVRAVLDLARHAGDGRRKTREIAAAMNIPAGYLSQILAALVQSGLAVATAGREGGYQLARPAESISLLDVIQAMDGPIGVRECLLRGIPCGVDGHCAVHDAWSRAQDALNAELASTGFAELARRT
ncbi:MAG: Rrf2 family transcriptional regulator [Ardenticatenales bacterium]